jgi:hypothetical protein
MVASAAVAVLFVACGSRTALLSDEAPDASAADARLDHTADVFHREGGPLDVSVECATPAYCNPSDPGDIWKCGVPVFQCSSLEQCEEVHDATAECVNPCVDTLGQNTSNGCEFYAVEMDTTLDVMGACYAVFIVNQWATGEPARIEVDLAGVELPVDQFARIPTGQGTSITYAPYDPAAGLPKDEVAVLFLSRDPAALNDPTPSDPRVLASCPPGVTPAVVGDASLHGTGVGSSFHIKTNVPVVAYQMLPFGGGSARVTGATLLLPVNVWGTNYLAANAYAAPTTIITEPAGPTMVILGQVDGTQVTIKPTSDIQPGGALQGSLANQPTTYTVNRGQYLQFTQPEELTGSAIQSDQPIAVIGGSTLMDLPLDKVRADSAEQMLPPVQALGSEYVGARYRARVGRGDESVPWRIVGAVDGTVLTFDPPQASAPGAVGARELVEFASSGPFVVSSQDAAHPFYLAQYMTGGQYLSGTDPADGEGDPEFVNVVSPQQYLPRYTFFTDPTYPETNLVVVRLRDVAGNMPDVTLDCAGVLAGWQPVGSSSKYEYTRVDLSTGDFQGVGGCDNGVHVVEGTGAFGVTVWGWGNPITWPDPKDQTNPRFTRWVSYGYPAGANITPLNSVVVPAR